MGKRRDTSGINGRKRPNTPTGAGAASDPPIGVLNERLLDMHEVRRRLGNRSRKWVEDKARGGELPAAIPIGRRRFWLEREISQWIADRQRDRDADA